MEGRGLFTKQFILKGTCIVEYKGKVSAWKEIPVRKVINEYVYYINRNHVIDTMLYKERWPGMSTSSGSLHQLDTICKQYRQ